MRYAQIRNMDISNGTGIGIALFTQGCRFHCKNCFNQDLWNFDGGKEWNKEAEDKIIELASKPFITRLSILGGEPLSFENINDLTYLLKRFKKIYPDKKIWLYSGYTYDIIDLELLRYVDILVDGQYVDDLKDYKLKFRGSSNQRIIDVQRSIEEGCIVLWKERNYYDERTN